MPLDVDVQFNLQRFLEDMDRRLSAEITSVDTHVTDLDHSVTERLRLLELRATKTEAQLFWVNMTLWPSLVAVASWGFWAIAGHLLTAAPTK